MAELAKAMHHPRPQVVLGLTLREIAHAALDISDGLLADLQHILKASHKGAKLDWRLFPRPELLATIPMPVLQQAVLAGGDDYELCFTASPARREQILQLEETLGVSLTRIGEITASPGLTVFDDERQIELSKKGYNHFG